MRSRLVGDWNGWAGDTVVELDNGSVWQQVEYYYRYQYRYRPTATVTSNKMEVEGMPRAVRVQRLR